MKILEYTSDDTAEYHEYDPESPKVFAEVKSLLQETHPKAQIDHIGSTAAGVGGKGIIDIQLVDEDPDISQLHDLGFTPGIPPRKEQPEGNPRVVLNGAVSHHDKTYNLHVHVMKPGHPTIKRAIFFREYLKKHPEDAREYESLKKKAVEQKRLKNAEYNPVKESLIKKVLSGFKDKEKRKKS